MSGQSPQKWSLRQGLLREGLRRRGTGEAGWGRGGAEQGWFQHVQAQPDPTGALAWEMHQSWSHWWQGGRLFFFNPLYWLVFGPEKPLGGGRCNLLSDVVPTDVRQFSEKAVSHGNHSYRS